MYTYEHKTAAVVARLGGVMDTLASLTDHAKSLQLSIYPEVRGWRYVAAVVD